MTDSPTPAQLLAKADAAAYKHLRVTYQQEFNEAKSKAAAELGVQWAPKPTKADRDRAELVRILNENPDLQGELRKQIVGEAAQASADQAPVS